MTEEIRQRVARQIEEAFADTPYPGDENIGWGCGSEGSWLVEAFRGKHWRELSLELILDNRDKLPCTTPEGFRFYLPAWMLAVLFHYETRGVDILYESLIFNLSPQHMADLQQHFLRHIGQFSVEEKTVILSFLEGFAELYPSEIRSDAIMPLRFRRLSLAIAFWKETAA